MDEEARRLRRTGSIKEIFRRRRMKVLLPSDLTVAGSEFHTVGAATEKAQPTSLVVVNVVAIIFQKQFPLPVLSSDKSKGQLRKCKHRRNFL